MVGVGEEVDCYVVIGDIVEIGVVFVDYLECVECY